MMVRCGVLRLPLMAVLLLTPGFGHADALTNYQVKVITQVGQKGQDFVPSGYLAVDALNDADQIVFGAFLPGNHIGLVQYSGGVFTTIAVARGPGPNGQAWPSSLDFYTPISTNKTGDLALVAVNSSGPLGVYRWDNANKSLLPVAEKGTPLANSLVFESGGNAGAAAINNRDEMAFIGTMKTANNQKTFGVFLRRPDGQIQAVAVPGDPLPGHGGTVQAAGIGTINDAGLIAVGAIGTQSGGTNGAYLWENGSLSLIAERDTDIPGFGAIGSAFVVGVSNADRNVLISTSLRKGGKTGLFLWNSGQFTPVVVEGDDLPGGGKLKRDFWVGLPSEAGQYPLLTSITENGATRTAAYVIGADGKLTLVLKSGMTTALGTITQVGGHGANIMVVNSQGEVGLVLQFDKGPDTLALLTPQAP